jgi:hypothetical protein
LPPADAAVIESRGPKMDLPCAVKPVAPELGPDFDFHRGYEVNVPLRSLTGSRNVLTFIFRVTPEDRPEEAVHLSQTWEVPAIEDAATGVAELRGAFVLGEGTYQINWLLRDQTGEFRSAGWQL